MTAMTGTTPGAMTALASLACPGCRRGNAAHRGYCGGCGVTLQPVCRGCRFVNAADDRFCGGCGSPLIAAATPMARPKAVPPPVPTPAAPAAPAVITELTGLFTPSATAAADDSLPSAAITQADIDRLFGSVA